MKQLKLMSVLLGGLVAFCSLTACGDDNDDSVEPQPGKQQVASARVEYQVSVSQDLLDVATVTAHYIDDNGKQAQEDLSQTSWNKTVTIATLPSPAGYTLQARLKGDPSEEEYTIGASGRMTVTLLDQKGNPIGNPFVGTAPSLQSVLGPDHMEKYFTRIYRYIQITKAIGEDGSISDTTIDWGINSDVDDPNRVTGVSNEGATGTTRSGGF